MRTHAIKPYGVGAKRPSAAGGGGSWVVKNESQGGQNVSRFPGSREDDAWLSDEQLAECAPAETDELGSPVPTRMILEFPGYTADNFSKMKQRFAELV